MKGTIPKHSINHFKDMLIEGKTYHIFGFIVVPTQASYKVNVYPFSIRLLKNTFVKVINEKNNSISFYRFKFLEFKFIISFLCSSSALNICSCKLSILSFKFIFVLEIFDDNSSILLAILVVPFKYFSSVSI